MALHPGLESGNYIIRALWLPGEQTQLALLTADFIKIYDLSVDAVNPKYHYLVPSGKVRDGTFVYSQVEINIHNIGYKSTGLGIWVFTGVPVAQGHILEIERRTPQTNQKIAESDKFRV